jgi:putative Mn2+ efflux pump MntP
MMIFGLATAGIGAIEFWYPLPPLLAGMLFVVLGFMLIWERGIQPPVHKITSAKRKKK